MLFIFVACVCIYGMLHIGSPTGPMCCSESIVSHIFVSQKQLWDNIGDELYMTYFFNCGKKFLSRKIFK